MKRENSNEAILKLARQFMESRILLSAAEMNIFTLIAEKPSTAKDLAGTLKADLRALTIFLDALAAMGLLSKNESLYATAPEAAPFLTDKSPQSVLPMVLHAAHLWESWSGLTHIVKGSGLTGVPVSSASDAGEMRAFIGAMHVVAMPLAQKIAAAVLQHGPSGNLIDVGGASGTYTIAFLNAAPEMKATLFDRPAVIEIARGRLADAGMLDRVRLVSGDFYKDELPGGHDLVLLSAIIHQNSPVENVKLFRKVLRAMVPGGRLVIRDHVMEPSRTEPADGAIFAVNMLVNTPGGSTYTFDEINHWLEEAGFTGIRLLKTGKHMDALIEAIKPA
ncbi:MAG: 3-hydroxy-5-methyl-1-naphthoate 3-O-methyltransferase [Syntrophus sp. SKADARSKE-3]|nr:3-hydroxy-5-methyl-1-naphthoate 3-O-methyltransferase [Syntrophus sp. SKADARSKE-3]